MEEKCGEYYGRPKNETKWTISHTKQTQWANVDERVLSFSSRKQHAITADEHVDVIVKMPNRILDRQTSPQQRLRLENEFFIVNHKISSRCSICIQSISSRCQSLALKSSHKLRHFWVDPNIYWIMFII